MTKKINKAKIMAVITELPKKIVAHSEHPATAHCILYEIANELCLDLLSVAYFVYNPDFKMCKGIAAIEHEKIQKWQNDPWGNAEEFEDLINSDEYNKKVRSVFFHATEEQNNTKAIAQEIQRRICSNETQYIHWKIKNNNIGILLYQFNAVEEIEDDLLETAISLLSFCPTE